MTSSLPTPQEFMAGFMKPEAAREVLIAPIQQAPEVAGVSREFRALIVSYCAATVTATQLSEVKWGALAKRLGTQAEFLAEAAAAIDAQSGSGALWGEVLGVRIKTAAAARVFRDNSWERLESLATDKLIHMAERNMIRDPGELLAIATQARRANTAGEGGGGGNQTNINVNVGDGAMGDNGLPAAGTKLTIDLSPRVASALSRRAGPQAEVGSRVIDGEMLSASELRSVLEQKMNPAQAKADDAEGDDTFGQPFEGDE